jgi:hypothetical protein
MAAKSRDCSDHIQRSTEEGLRWNKLPAGVDTGVERELLFVMYDYLGRVDAYADPTTL